MTGGPRKTHSEETIAAALRLYLAGEMTICEISEAIGVPQHTITGWRQKFGWARMPRRAIPTGNNGQAHPHRAAEAPRANFATLKRRRMPPPEDADRLVREWLERHEPTLCPSAAVAPIQTNCGGYSW